MPTFTVHVPPGVDDDAARADRTVFVRDGFDWAAFLFGPLALLYRGLWRAALAWTLAAAALLGLAVGVGLADGARLALYLVLAILTGLEAGEARRRALARAGYIGAAVLAGVTREAGERSYFRSGPASGAPGVLKPRPGVPPDTGRPAVLGLFPMPGGEVRRG